MILSIGQRVRNSAIHVLNAL